MNISRKLAITAFGILLASVAHADAAEDRTAQMNVGSVLAWRLGPETIEERCRSADPDGAQIRQSALRAWEKKYADLIRAVDERIAEVIPLLSPGQPKERVLESVRSQVRVLILEPLADAKSPADIAAFCKSEADPANPRWNNRGIPMVPSALAELYDWKIKKTAP